MYSATVNDRAEFKLSPQDLVWDAVPTDSGYHIIHEGRSFDVTIVRALPAEKHYVLRINGRVYEVKIQDELDQLMHRLGLDKQTGPKINQIKAPMPGLVINVAVEVGQTVQKGESVLILEAMKMENVIKSPGDGKIKAVHVRQGSPVEKNQVLIELE
jgi:biotin carboxyl carrier protein